MLSPHVFIFANLPIWKLGRQASCPCQASVRFANAQAAEAAKEACDAGQAGA